jgi:hypothetical protein
VNDRPDGKKLQVCNHVEESWAVIVRVMLGRRIEGKFVKLTRWLPERDV